MYKDKDVNISLLLDFYGELLPGIRREALELYYNDDMSLAEISDEIGISRQGVRDRIVKGEKMLFDYEEKLGMVARFSGIRADIGQLIEELGKIPDSGEKKKIEEIALRLQERM